MVSCLVRSPRRRRFDDDGACDDVAKPLAPIAKDEDPVEESQDAQQQVPHERLAWGARTAALLVHHGKSQDALSHALPARKAVAEQHVQDDEQERGEEDHIGERIGSDDACDEREDDDRNHGDDGVEHLRDQTGAS